VTFPWIPSRYTDKEGVCGFCKRPIPVGQARMYNMSTKESAHIECQGAKEMGDHGAPVAPVEDRSAAIERMHAEKMREFTHIGNAVAAGLGDVREGLDRLKASLVETNMILSVFTEYFVKMKEANK
jgi:hypothetical protein